MFPRSTIIFRPIKCRDCEGSSRHISFCEFEQPLSIIYILYIYISFFFFFFFTYLCVLRLKKNPNNFKACKRINWLSAANNLKIVLTPCFASKAGTMDEGCSDIKDISICRTSCKFSSCVDIKKKNFHYNLLLNSRDFYFIYPITSCIVVK